MGVSVPCHWPSFILASISSFSLKKWIVGRWRADKASEEDGTSYAQKRQDNKRQDKKRQKKSEKVHMLILAKCRITSNYIYNNKFARGLYATLHDNLLHENGLKRKCTRKSLFTIKIEEWM